VEAARRLALEEEVAELRQALASFSVTSGPVSPRGTPLSPALAAASAAAVSPVRVHSPMPMPGSPPPGIAPMMISDGTPVRARAPSLRSTGTRRKSERELTTRLWSTRVAYNARASTWIGLQLNCTRVPLCVSVCLCVMMGPATSTRSAQVYYDAAEVYVDEGGSSDCETADEGYGLHFPPHLPMCMYVCVFVSVYVCVRVCVTVYVCVHVSAFVCVCT
jgi:hypothetical protein